METETAFIKASRVRLRFETQKGSISSEDLWSLPLTSGVGKLSLDSIAVETAARIKDKAGITSFVNPSNKPQDMDELRLEILLYIIDHRKAENNAAAVAKANKDKKEIVLQALSEKQNDKLKSMSEEELEALAKTL